MQHYSTLFVGLDEIRKELLKDEEFRRFSSRVLVLQGQVRERRLLLQEP